MEKGETPLFHIPTPEEPLLSFGFPGRGLDLGWEETETPSLRQSLSSDTPVPKPHTGLLPSPQTGVPVPEEISRYTGLSVPCGLRRS